ncbi:hypothetical protein BKA83DRAFT_14905 [Pisolithus microcarpus]|nr:hypothetical protein BKA83DRAFT_14905 [Pisolithus microcarpus]
MRWIAFRGRPSVEYHDRIVVALSVDIASDRKCTATSSAGAKAANSSMANNASDDEDETRSARKQQSRVKRRKTNAGRPIATGHRSTRARASPSGILDAFQHGIPLGSTSDKETRDDECFNVVVESLLPEYLQTRHDTWAQRCDINEPACCYEPTALLDYANKKTIVALQRATAKDFPRPTRQSKGLFHAAGPTGFASLDLGLAVLYYVHQNAFADALQSRGGYVPSIS